MEKEVKNSRQVALLFIVGTLCLMGFFIISLGYGLTDYKTTMQLSLTIKFFSFLAVIAFISYKFNEVILFLGDEK